VYSHPVFTPQEKQPDTVLCNCWAYAKTVYPTLPGTKVINASLSSIPDGVVVFNYSGTPHYAVVTAVGSTTVTITETNYTRCTKGTRTIPLTDPSIKGYYHTKSPVEEGAS
jgi:hypothetical protein